MTEDQIRIAIAEICGYKVPFRFEYWVNEYLLDGEGRSVPDYPFYLDDCAKFEKTLTDVEEKALYAAMLHCGNDERYWACATATPLRRCEAFLRVKGKWKE